MAKIWHSKYYSTLKHKENGKKKENVKKLILMITTMISSTHKIVIYTLKIIVKN